MSSKSQENQQPAPSQDKNTDFNKSITESVDFSISKNDKGFTVSNTLPPPDRPPPSKKD